MAKKRDSKGRFAKGNREGVKFTSTRQPKNAGRKPSRFKRLLKELEGVGETISVEDYGRITKTLLTLNAEELQGVAQDKSTPIAVIMIANAISGDLNNQRIDNLEKLLDRVFGKSSNPIDVTTNGQSIGSLSMVEAQKIIKELENDRS